jgi:hypothetical protein
VLLNLSINSALFCSDFKLVADLRKDWERMRLLLNMKIADCCQLNAAELTIGNCNSWGDNNPEGGREGVEGTNRYILERWNSDGCVERCMG